MNLDKAKKRIAKKVKMGFQGYPEISITYLGESKDIASEVLVTFIAEEGAEAMEQRFPGKTDVREDEVIQSAIVKIIERSEIKTVKLTETISLKA
jgi:hypothetical protein